MKGLEWCDMDESEMDAYISRCMKNWAALRNPAPDGRQRLLRAASIRPDLYGTRIGMPIANLLKSLFYSQTIIEPEQDWSFVPLTQSRLWSFHMVTSPRLTL